MDVFFQKLFMQLVIWLFNFLDSIFGVFGTLAGVEQINTVDGEMSLTQYFFQQSPVYQAFFGVFICSIAVLAVCIVVSVIKSVVNMKGGEQKSHAKTVGQGLGSIVVTLTLAIIMGVGIFASDALLGQLNKVMNTSDITISQSIFGLAVNQSYALDEDNVQGLNRYEEQDGKKVCTYVAYLYEYVRDGDQAAKYTENGLTKFLNSEGGEIKFEDAWIKSSDSAENTYEGTDGNRYKLDVSKLVLQPPTVGWRENPATGELFTEKDVRFDSATTDQIYGVYGRSFPWIFEDSAKYEQGTGMVRINNFNFLIAFLCGIIVLVALVSGMLGLVKRIYDLVLLFLALPLISATIPLDDGAKFKLWRETVISKMVLAYGSVFAVNVFMLITPLIMGFNIGGGMTETIFKIFMICGGALTISGGQLLFARLVGGDAGESREMAQSARTMLGGAMTTYGLGKAGGRMMFGQKNANGQRIGGLFKTAGGALGAVGGGAVNGLGSAVGGQAYRSSKLGRGASSVQRALKGFSGSAGWSAGAIGSAVRDVPTSHSTANNVNDANGYETPGAWDKGLLGRWTQRGQQAANLKKGAKLAVKSAHFKPGKTNLGKINNTNKKK